MAKSEIRFEFADRGPTSVYKFRVKEDPTYYVWFEYGPGQGGLYTTPRSGPYAADDPLEDCDVADLDALLAARGTTKRQWVADLMAQYGERLAWVYP